MKTFVQRWWIFGTLPLGILVGWLTKPLPPVISALFVVAATLIAAGIIYWRERVWRRHTEDDLVAALADMPVYLTSDLWAMATKNGLINPAVLERVRQKRAERRAAERDSEAKDV